MATIPKTSRRAQDLLARATECKVHSQATYYRGEPCDPRNAAADLLQFRFAKLRDDGNDRYRVHVSGNLWYEFKAS